MPTEEQLFEVMQCIEDYLKAQEDLSAALKDGMFSIARGKYSLGSELGQQRYPGDMSTTVLVDIVPAQHEGSLYGEFKLRPCSKEQGRLEKQPHMSAEDDTAHPEADGARTSSTREQHSHNQADPVTWFAALPPPPVRQAQKDFVTVLQRVVAAANALQRLQQATGDYSEVTDDAASDVDR